MRGHAPVRRHAGALALALLAVAAAPTAADAGRACAGASADPGALAPATLRAALRCVLNGERARHGLPALRADAHLARAARRHARDMVDRRYFDHERPGWTLPGRLREAGWAGGSAGEALSWGCGGRGTPEATVRAWLRSPPHRAIVLGAGFRRAGIGLVAGAPIAADCGGAGTWVLVAGS